MDQKLLNHVRAELEQNIKDTVAKKGLKVESLAIDCHNAKYKDFKTITAKVNARVTDGGRFSRPILVDKTFVSTGDALAYFDNLEVY